MDSVSQPLVGLAPTVKLRPAAAPIMPGWRRFLRRLFVVVIAVTFIRTFIGEAAMVPTSSMEGTILVGDHILLNKFAYGPAIPFTSVRLPRLKSIERGAIVAFTYPKDPNLTFLKRVVAIGGDTVELRGGILYVNQIPVRESYMQHRLPVWKRHGDEMRPLRVATGELFVLGDNRDNSDDSRYWGTVPEQNVIGEPLLVLWSYDAPSAAWLNESAAAQVRLYSSIASHLFTRTRWSRMGIIL